MSCLFLPALAPDMGGLADACAQSLLCSLQKQITTQVSASGEGLTSCPTILYRREHGFRERILGRELQTE